jgi:hypothetical protein
MQIRSILSAFLDLPLGGGGVNRQQTAGTCTTRQSWQLQSLGQCLVSETNAHPIIRLYYWFCFTQIR